MKPSISKELVGVVGYRNSCVGSIGKWPIMLVRVSDSSSSLLHDQSSVAKREKRQSFQSSKRPTNSNDCSDSHQSKKYRLAGLSGKSGT